MSADFSRAAELIASAEALLIGAGAGMGVDSGLPDFRGDEGFWKAYPPFRGRRFAEMSNPVWFQRDPAQAWGFFGHRLNLYRSAIPHQGFEILHRWGSRLPGGMFVFTSNVDGQFQKAGFSDEQVYEVHGSIHYEQCSRPCGLNVWPTPETTIDVDPETIRAVSPIPRCPRCNAVARPNILMFGDWNWLESRSAAQAERYAEWLNRVANLRLVAIELGAGLAIPTVRLECEDRASALIRINPREPEGPEHCVSLPVGAHAALVAIDELLP